MTSPPVIGPLALLFIGDRDGMVTLSLKTRGWGGVRTVALWGSVTPDDPLPPGSVGRLGAASWSFDKCWLSPRSAPLCPRPVPSGEAKAVSASFLTPPPVPLPCVTGASSQEGSRVCPHPVALGAAAGPAPAEGMKGKWRGASCVPGPWDLALPCAFAVCETDVPWVNLLIRGGRETGGAGPGRPARAASASGQASRGRACVPCRATELRGHSLCSVLVQRLTGTASCY